MGFIYISNGGDILLDKNVIEKVLNAALSHGGDFAEVFVEDKHTSNIELVGGLVEDNVAGRDFGVGIRIFDKFNSIYAYTNNSKEDNLIKIAKQAGLALKTGDRLLEFELIKESLNNKNIIKLLPSTIGLKQKVDLLKMGYKAAKDYNPIISQVSTFYLEEEQNVLIANTEGIFRQDKRVRTRYGVTSISEKNGEMQQGFYAPGASLGFEFFDKWDVREIAEESARIATVMANADHSPSGNMPVIIDNEFGGVLFHEACGHALEASFVSKDTSSFANKIGQLVASPLVTAIDDGTIPNEWGTTTIDDEGTETKRNVLIENGILKSYLVDKLHGRRMGVESTGSSRRQSYKFAPTSRMNNTFIDRGQTEFEDMISNTEKGLYAKKLGGGSVNPATGDFNFAVMEGYIIENGKLTKPVRGATIVGNGVKVLEKIDMVGKNLTLGQGMCGAASGSIPAGLGQPAIRVKELTVGGREE